MKRKILISAIIAIALYGCKKSDNTNTNPNVSTVPTQNGNVTTYSNGYTVKTIGIARVLVSVDANNNLVAASLFGGGNRVIIKPGTTNTISANGFIQADPDAITAGPDGNLIVYPISNKVIDNGQMPDTSSSSQVFKITGFDKKVTGYDQLNLVVEKNVTAGYITASYDDNIDFMNFNRPNGKSNTDYNTTYFSALFNRKIAVTTLEIAKPLSQNPYITEDEIIERGQLAYGILTNSPTALTANFSGLYYAFGLQFQSSDYSRMTVGLTPNLKFQWVNADNATIKDYGDNYTYGAIFPNIKSGVNDQIPEPADSVSKVYLRISGFNPAVCGFNQLRLFITKDANFPTLWTGEMQFSFNTKQTAPPTLATIKNGYISAQTLYPNVLNFPSHHY